VVVPHTLGVSLQVYRQIHNFGSPFQGADGANAWDYNATEPNGTHVDGHPPYLFESGALTSVSGLVLTDSNKNWATNQWANHNLRRTSDGATAIIVSNTAHSLTITEWIGQSWATGNGYQIHKVLRIMDQPGLGAGGHISRASPAWPDQDSEPCYSWNNTNDDDSSSFGFINGTASTTIQAGRDYRNDTPMPGYVPYTYPHPLATGTGTPTPTPTGTPTPEPSATPTPSASPTSTATVTPTPPVTATSTPTSTPPPLPPTPSPAAPTIPIPSTVAA